jgi:catalase-peroxidase
MAMNDEETVALIAGGHTFGKAHGAATPQGNIGPDPEGAPLEEQGFGWSNAHGKGNAADTITSGLEGAWTSAPNRWSHMFLSNLFAYDWELTKSPAGAHQWVPKDGAGQGTVPDAHDPTKSHAPIMFTTDLALRMDPAYEKISRRFFNHPREFEEAFAKAWYKLTHRDMGPLSRFLGPEVPSEPLLWQDPVPPVDHALIGEQDVADLKRRILASPLTVPQLVSAAWASASTFRGSDLRGGANGARVRLAPQKDWEVNQPEQLAQVLATLESIQEDFHAAHADGSKKVSLADLIVLGGGAAIEEAARKAGHAVSVPFLPGRTDATEAMTDSNSFAVMEPKQDGFRNYLGPQLDRSAPETLVDRAQLLTLSAPEMTVLVGGMRVLGITAGHPDRGVLTTRRGELSNDFFVHLLDMATQWKVSSESPQVFEGRDRRTGALTWTATSFDLVFGSNSQLRAIAEVYASNDGRKKFVEDFVAAWVKVMNLDRFDLQKSS